jgi:hypothetical protein
MRSRSIVDAAAAPAKAGDEQCVAARNGGLVRVLGIALLLAALGAPGPAKAVDGCLMLLCFAAPNWRAIPQCVPPIREVLRDLARGRSFPSCSMAGAGNSATHAWARAPGRCPPQYTRILPGPAGPIHFCDFHGAVSVSINGDLFATTWWSRRGDTVTEFSPVAKAQLGQWDTRFDDDHAAWLATQVPEAPTWTPY